MLHDPTFWAFAALLVFLGIMVYVKVPGQITGALDKHGQAIKAELDEAARLRQEAQALLESYKKRQQEAAQEAETIVRDAEAAAQRMASEAEAKLNEYVARRTKMAEMKIAQAEAQALGEVRGIAADVAVSAAEKVLRDQGSSSDLMARAISDVKAKLN